MERGRALTDILILILISSLCERPWALFSSSQTCLFDVILTLRFPRASLLSVCLLVFFLLVFSSVIASPRRFLHFCFSVSLCCISPFHVPASFNGYWNVNIKNIYVTRVTQPPFTPFQMLTQTQTSSWRQNAMNNPYRRAPWILSASFKLCESMFVRIFRFPQGFTNCQFVSTSFLWKLVRFGVAQWRCRKKVMDKICFKFPLVRSMTMRALTSSSAIRGSVQGWASSPQVPWLRSSSSPSPGLSD